MTRAGLERALARVRERLATPSLSALDEVVRFSAEEGMSHAHLATSTNHLTDYTLEG